MPAMEPQPPPMTYAPASHSHPHPLTTLYYQQHEQQQEPHHYYIPSPREYAAQTHGENGHYQSRQPLQLQTPVAREHDSVLSHHQYSHKGSSPPSPVSSASSGGRHKRAVTAEIQPALAQSQSRINLPYPAQARVQDPEKAASAASPRHSPRSQRTHVSSSNPDGREALYESGDYSEKGPEERTVQLLLFLSGPCAFLSMGICLWTFAALFISLLLQPLRLLSTRPTLSAQLTTFLAPALNLQLHLIYSYSLSTDYSTPLLVVVHLLSPLVVLGVAIGAWTAACFWFFSAILGDPAGQDGRNDGKESILGVRNWWDRWLSRALR